MGRGGQAALGGPVVRGPVVLSAVVPSAVVPWQAGHEGGVAGEQAAGLAFAAEHAGEVAAVHAECLGGGAQRDRPSGLASGRVAGNHAVATQNRT